MFMYLGKFSFVYFCFVACFGGIKVKHLNLKWFN